MMSVSEIAILLNRSYPMLLLDGVTYIDSFNECRAYKNLTYNEWFFPAHFPDNPIMPGSIQIEAFTQAVALPLLVGERNNGAPSIPLLLVGADKVRFYRPVVPGDKFEIKAKIERHSLGIATASAVGYVNNEIASECKITYKIMGG